MSRSAHLPIVVGAALAMVACGSIAPASEPSDESTIDLPSFGVRLNMPRGWFRAPELHFSQLARLERFENKKLVGLIEVDSALAKGRSSRGVATKLAADRGGRIGENLIRPNGLKLTVVELPGTKELKAMRVGLIEHGDELIAISVGEKSKSAAESTMAVVLESLVLSKPIAAVDDLELRKRPIALFNSDVLVVLPEPFRIVEIDPKSGKQTFGVRDLPSGRDEASISVRVVANLMRVAPEKYADGMARVVASTFGVKRPVFTKVNDKPPTYLSTPYADAKGTSSRIVLIETDTGQLRALFLRTTASSAEARDAYCDALEKVAKSARVSKEYGEGRRAVTDESDE